MFTRDHATTTSLKHAPRRLYLLGALIALMGLSGCDEKPTGEDLGNIARYEAELTAAERRARYTMMRDSLRARGIENTGFLFGGIANSETNLAHCWDEATWACQGPNSVDCGNRPVIAGAGDGPCSLQEGGLGMFQFDAGTFAQTLAAYGQNVLTIDGQMHHVLNFVTNMLTRSVYLPSVSTTAQAMAWLNAFDYSNTTQRSNWIKTVTRYYNGCQENWSCWSPRIGTYTDGLTRAVNEVGLAFWSEGGSSGISGLPASVTSNGTISAVNWAGDQHAEVWVRGQNGELHHAWSHSNAEWSDLHSRGAAASCGFAATHWPEDPDYIETFFPTPDGGSGHLWFASGWMGPGDYGGNGLSEFSTLLWPDGRNEVFALAPDGKIHNRFWDAGESEWSEWRDFSGGLTFKAGATAIVWGDGRPEVFATDSSGHVWSRWWQTNTNAWSDWYRSFGDAKMASRPMPIRWTNGRLEIFAQGVDGYLYHSWFLDNQWADLQRLGDQKILGEPSPIFNRAGNGGPSGPQVFARDENGRLFEIHMESNAWVEFRPLLADRELASEPFAWVRRDGVVMLFAVDTAGNLIHSHRDRTQGWQPWSIMAGAKVDDCTAQDGPGDGGPGDGDPGDGGPGDGGPGDDGPGDGGPGDGGPGDGSDDDDDDDGNTGGGSNDDGDDENDPGNRDKDRDPFVGSGYGNYGDVDAGDGPRSSHDAGGAGCSAAPGADTGWAVIAAFALAYAMRRRRLA